MTRRILLLAVLLLSACALPAGTTDEQGPNGGITIRNGQEWATYTSAGLGVQFAYRQFPDGYVLRSPKGDDADVLATLTLIRQSDYDALQNNQAPRDGPAAIVLEIFNAPGATSPQDWVQSTPRANAPAQGNFRRTTLGGETAVRYKWDGLYASESVVTLHAGRAYVFTVSSPATTDSIHADFEEILNTVKLIGS